MSNKRVGGIPYLRTTFKFDFNSMENMDEDAKSAFVEELKIRLLPCVELFDIDIPGPSSGHELKNEQISIGLQSVFDHLTESKAEVVLFDSTLVKPSGVSNMIALFANNSGATSYSVENLSKLLSSWNLIADALATTDRNSKLNEFLKSGSLRPIVPSPGSKLKPAVITQSQGKKNKKK